MNFDDKIYIAGHTGMVGQVILKKLIALGYNNLVYVSSDKLDLRKQKETFDFLSENKPDIIFLIAGRVGGILANIKYPAQFLYDNLMIAANVIEAAKIIKVKKLLFLGSSCIYPRNCPQPMKEEYLLSGYLEPTNEGYAIAKIAGVKLCEYYNKEYNCNFISAIPPNLYGPYDNFKNENSHVISALIKRIHDAKISGNKNVTIWGTGKARREFLFVEDLADGLIFLMNNYNENTPINIGYGNDFTIKEIAEIIKEVVEYKGEFIYDETKPDGMPKKLMDSSKIFNLGWKPQTDIYTGIKKTYEWYLNNYESKQNYEVSFNI